MHECLFELALHLKNAGQVRVSSCKLWIDLVREEGGVGYNVIIATTFDDE